MAKRIETKDLDIYYGSFHAVESVNLIVEPRTVTAFIGPSGCGKSTVLRSTEEMLKLVPDSLREASFALGVSQWKTIMKVVLPTSMTGILTGIVLGLARVMGETAPLIVLLQFNTELTFNPSTPNFATLPTVITNAYTQGGVDTPVVWGAAITLIILVMGLNLIARRISRRYMRRMGK